MIFSLAARLPRVWQHRTDRQDGGQDWPHAVICDRIAPDIQESGHHGLAAEATD